MFSYTGAAYKFLFAFLSGICSVQVSLCAADAQDESDLCYEVLSAVGTQCFNTETEIFPSLGDFQIPSKCLVAPISAKTKPGTKGTCLGAKHRARSKAMA